MNTNKINEYFWDCSKGLSGQPLSSTIDKYNQLYLILKSAESDFSDKRSRTNLTYNADVDSPISRMLEVYGNLMVSKAPVRFYVGGMVNFIGILNQYWHGWNDPFMPFDQIVLTRNDEHIVLYVSEGP